MLRSAWNWRNMWSAAVEVVLWARWCRVGCWSVRWSAVGRSTVRWSTIRWSGRSMIRWSRSVGSSPELAGAALVRFLCCRHWHRHLSEGVAGQHGDKESSNSEGLHVSESSNGYWWFDSNWFPLLYRTNCLQSSISKCVHIQFDMCNGWVIAVSSEMTPWNMMNSGCCVIWRFGCF